jgi:tetratricopeptide (TPR) repeat protein
LTFASKPYIDQILRRDSTEEKVKFFIKKVIDYSKGSADEFHRAEIFLYCGAVEYSIGLSEEAIQHIQQAEQIYTDQYECHRLAVASWILGIVELETIYKRYGYAYWGQALQLFKKISEEPPRFFDPARKVWISNHDKQRWYSARSKEMMEDLVCLPEEAFRWLNEFSSTHLSDIAQGIKQLALEKLNKGQFTSVYQLVEELRKLCKDCSDYLEIPEIMVECGLVEYEMGNLDGAIDLVNQAVSSFNPCSHQQAVARWMLGAFLWQVPSKINQATMNWEQAISCFSDLSDKADHSNHPSLCSWYREKMGYMLKALNNEANANFSKL